MQSVLPHGGAGTSKRRVVGGVLLMLCVAGAVLGLSLRSARSDSDLPFVDSETLQTETVRRGDMLQQVRGIGTLVAEQLMHLPAPYTSRVEAADVLPGTATTPDTVVVRLKNVDMEQQVRDAALSLETAEADLTYLKAQSESQRVSQQTDMAALQAQYRDAKLKNDRDQILFKDGLLLELDYRLSTNAVSDLAARIEAEKKKGAALLASLDAQIASKTVAVRQLRETLQLRRDQIRALTVRAGVTGTVEQVLVQVGQEVSAGMDLAVIVQPHRLKAALAIPEIRARDVTTGRPASIEISGAIVPGKVTRIDPSVVNGTRTVDVRLEGPLPADAVPDKTVDGSIDIERLHDVVYVSRSAADKAPQPATRFILSADGKQADRVQIRWGRTSENSVEIATGAKSGDRMILSDMARFDQFEHVRVR